MKGIQQIIAENEAAVTRAEQWAKAEEAEREARKGWKATAFVVEGGWDYEGFTICGIFTTEEAAIAHMNTITERFDTLSVEAYELK